MSRLSLNVCQPSAEAAILSCSEWNARPFQKLDLDSVNCGLSDQVRLIAKQLFISIYPSHQIVACGLKNCGEILQVRYRSLLECAMTNRLYQVRDIVGHYGNRKFHEWTNWTAPKGMHKATIELRTALQEKPFSFPPVITVNDCLGIRTPVPGVNTTTRNVHNCGVVTAGEVGSRVHRCTKKQSDCRNTPIPYPMQRLGCGSAWHWFITGPAILSNSSTTVGQTQPVEAPHVAADLSGVDGFDELLSSGFGMHDVDVDPTSCNVDSGNLRRSFEEANRLDFSNLHSDLRSLYPMPPKDAKAVFLKFAVHEYFKLHTREARELLPGSLLSTLVGQKRYAIYFNCSFYANIVFFFPQVMGNIYPFAFLMTTTFIETLLLLLNLYGSFLPFPNHKDLASL